MSAAAALGRAITVLRTERGLKRRELSEKAGLSYPYISEIENGVKEPSTRALRSIALALGIEAADLLALSERYQRPERFDPATQSGEPSHEPKSGLAHASPESFPRAPAAPAPDLAELRDVVKDAARDAVRDWAKDELSDIVRAEVREQLRTLRDVDDEDAG